MLIASQVSDNPAPHSPVIRTSLNSLCVSPNKSGLNTIANVKASANAAQKVDTKAFFISCASLVCCRRVGMSGNRQVIPAGRQIGFPLDSLDLLISVVYNSQSIRSHDLTGEINYEKEKVPAAAKPTRQSSDSGFYRS
jgi:hypothetical protein